MSLLQDLEQQRDKAKTLVEVRQMAMRLAQNHDFKKLILEGFCLSEAARYAQEAGDPALGREEREDCLAMAMASGHLKRFLSGCIQMGAHSERTMAEVEAAIEEERANPSEGGDE